MEMAPFHSRFPEIAEKETRCITLLQKKGRLPPGEYALMESYCNDPSCDCRRVFINILYKNKILATIGYGWEDRGFYREWFGSDDKDVISEMKGPVLELGGAQTKLAPALLKIFKEVILKDEAYIERLKRHYLLFKGKSGEG